LNLKIKSDQRNRRSNTHAEKSLRREVNWPLLVGLILVLIIMFLAIVGPDIAPKDPLKENIIIQINGEWYVPPFDFNTPGYPLGSDSFGRDLFSRVLWGVRPTMIMVMVVALVRLILGVLIGLSAGWFTGKTSQFLDGLIQVALALPVLLVALGAIALIGVEFGIWAFIIGLSLTGWVDTALQVREQTRIVKGQAYIEAASAMGATNQQILSNHILKQITPMLLMLFAFEISSTLMLTAGLGFLGYYIGGDVWVDTDDFVARRISGSPELGQMLATSWVTLTKPWAMVVVGTAVFITVLGFNLIGEGLRQSLGFTKVKRRGVFNEIWYSLSSWVDNYVWHPLVQFFSIKPLQVGLAGIAAIFVFGLGALLILDAAASSDASNMFSEFGQVEGATSVTNESTSLSDLSEISSSNEMEETITYDPAITWEFVDESGFSSGLAISPEGDRLYTASQSGDLYALNLGGNVIWQAELRTGGMGTPVVLENGEILVADKSGGLSRLSSTGELIWHFQTEAGDRSHSGPAVGPDGKIYYTVGTSGKGFVQAVSTDGIGIWVSQAETNSFFETPIPSLDEQFVFLKDDIFSTDNGEIIHLDTNLEILRFFTGNDGKNYFLAGHKVIQWEENNGVIDIIDIAEWDSSSFSQIIAPRQVNVSHDGLATLLYTTPGGSTTVVWVSLDDQLFGISETQISDGRLVSTDNGRNTIICGGGSFRPISTDCALMSPTSSNELWKYHLGNYGPVVGGVKFGDRLFVSTEAGYVLGINENSNKVTAQNTSELPNSSGALPIEPGISWTYQASDDIVNRPIIGRDSSVYIHTQDDKLHLLSSDGQSQTVIQLGASPYYHQSETGRSAPLYIAPSILPDGTIIVVSEDLKVSAFDPQGNIKWEDFLEGEPGFHPLNDGNGNLYILDNMAGLQAITKDGISWRFQSVAAPMPANGLLVGPDGNIYYVVTDYSKAYIQAVSSSGEELWVTQADTRDIYDELHISEDGQYVSIADNLFETRGGDTVEINPEKPIDEFIFGRDGRNYYRSLHSVYEWQTGANGLIILNQGNVSDDDTSLRPPLWSEADANGVIWLYYPERYVGGGIVIVWMTAEGELIGRFLIERNSQVINSISLDDSTLTECRNFEEDQILDCLVYSPLFDEPLMQNSIANIDPFEYGFLEENRAYLISENNNLVVVEIGKPTPSSE
jgi:peptide/nickel transport system permease protein